MQPSDWLELRKHMHVFKEYDQSIGSSKSTWLSHGIVGLLRDGLGLIKHKTSQHKKSRKYIKNTIIPSVGTAMGGIW